MKYIVLLIFCLFVLGCEKENENPNLIIKAKLIDENGYALVDNSGVNVRLIRGQELYQGTTDSKGECSFPDFPYGIFNVQFEKNGYISEYRNPQITYHDTDTSNVFSYNLVEVPKYEIVIDSITKSRHQYSTNGYYGYARLKNMKGKPSIQLSSRVYFSDKSDVSSEKYLFFHYGPMLIFLINGDKCIVWIRSDGEKTYIPPGYDTLYVRVYPIALNGDWYIVREEALGKPSEVFKWKVIY